MQEKKTSSFISGAAVLMAANLLVKLIGLAFKVPLTYLIGEEGMGHFADAYTIYTWLFVLATAGLPVAVSKMVSESVALGRTTEVRRILKVSLLFLLWLGTLGSAILFFRADLLAQVIGNPLAATGIRAVAPAMLFVSLMSAFRGFFQGKQDMVPTAVSEVFEAFGKLIFGYFLASFFLEYGVEMGAAGAVAGVSSGAVLGLISLSFLFLWKSKNIFTKNRHITSENSASLFQKVIIFAVFIFIGIIIFSLTDVIVLMDTFKKYNNLVAVAVVIASCVVAFGLVALLFLFLQKTAKNNASYAIFKKLIVIAIPITIGASVFSLTSVIDMAMIKHNLVDAGFSGEEAVRLWGSYSGYAVPIFNMPPTLLTAVSISLVPAIASAFISGRRDRARSNAESAIRITTLFALPCSAGVSLLATPILGLIYNNTNASSMLAILGWAIVFVSLVQITNAILQSVGKVYVPVVHMAVGGAVKVIINYFLVSNPAININGAPVGTIVCYVLILVLNLISIKKILGVKYSLGDMLLRPLFSTLIMGGVVSVLYWISLPFGRFIQLILVNVPIFHRFAPLLGQLIPVGVSILGGACVYTVMLFCLRAIKEEDVLLLPKGQKLARLLKRAKLLR